MTNIDHCDWLGTRASLGEVPARHPCLAAGSGEEVPELCKPDRWEHHKVPSRTKSRCLNGSVIKGYAELLKSSDSKTILSDFIMQLHGIKNA